MEPDDEMTSGDAEDVTIRIEIPPAFRDDYPDAYAEVTKAIRSGALPIEPDRGRRRTRYLGPHMEDRDPAFDHVVVLHDETDESDQPRRRRRRPRDPDTLTFTVEEAGEKLGISRALAYEAVRSGQIPSIHIGHRILVPKAALLRLLEAS